VTEDAKLMVLLVQRMNSDLRAFRQFWIVLADPNAKPTKFRNEHSGRPVGVYRMTQAQQERFLFAMDKYHYAHTELDAIRLARRLASRVGAERVR
jgi:hypothetical protein